MRIRAVAVGNFETEVVILYVGPHLRMRFGDTAEFGFPIAIEDDPVDVAAARVGLPAIGFRGVELHVHRGAGGIVGIENRFDRAAAHFGAGDGGGDALAGHVGELLIHELGRIGAAFADEASIEPLLRDALELSEQMELGFFAGVAPLGIDEPLGRGGRAAWTAADRPGVRA